MTLNFDTKFRDAFGREIETTDTIGKQLAIYLFGATRMGDRELNGTEKYNAFKLSRLLANGGDLEVTTEEATMLKTMAADAFTAGAYGQVLDIIEPPKSK